MINQIAKNYPAILNFALKAVGPAKRYIPPKLKLDELGINQNAFGTFSPTKNLITLNTSHLNLQNLGRYTYLLKNGETATTKSILTFEGKAISVPTFVAEAHVLPALQEGVVAKNIGSAQILALYYTSLLHEIRHSFDMFLPQSFYPLFPGQKTGCAYIGAKNLPSANPMKNPFSYLSSPTEISAYSFAARYTPSLLSQFMPHLDKNLIIALSKSQHYRAIAGLKIRKISQALTKPPKSSTIIA